MKAEIVHFGTRWWNWAHGHVGYLYQWTRGPALGVLEEKLRFWRFCLGSSSAGTWAIFHHVFIMFSLYFDHISPCLNHMFIMFSSCFIRYDTILCFKIMASTQVFQWQSVTQRFHFGNFILQHPKVFLAENLRTTSGYRWRFLALVAPRITGPGGGRSRPAIRATANSGPSRSWSLERLEVKCHIQMDGSFKTGVLIYVLIWGFCLVF